MRKCLVALLGVLLTVSLCSCSFSFIESSNNSAYTAHKYGTDYLVDPNNGTISDGKYVYQYELSAGSDKYSISITYPDGSTYWRHARNSGGVTTYGSGWSDDYDENRYVDGETLCDVLTEKIPRKMDSEKLLFVLLLLTVGIFNTIWPYGSWYLEYGWRYRDAEPSNLALGLNRFGGIIAIIAAVIMVFT